MLRKKLPSSYDVSAEEKRHPAKFWMARLIGRPIYLRQERQAGWKGAMPIYVRWCDECESFSVAYPAGYAERIMCDDCRKVQTVMTWSRFREQVLPVLLPPLLVCAAYAAFRMWWVSRGNS